MRSALRTVCAHRQPLPAVHAADRSAAPARHIHRPAAPNVTPAVTPLPVTRITVREKPCRVRQEEQSSSRPKRRCLLPSHHRMSQPASAITNQAQAPADLPRVLGAPAGHRHRRRHHHRQRHLPRPHRDDARHRLLRACLSRLDRRRPALAIRRHDLRRTRRHASLRWRRIRLPPRCLRRHARVSLYVDVVCRRQARIHRRRHHRPGAHAGILSRLPVPHAHVFGLPCSGHRFSPSPSPGS